MLTCYAWKAIIVEGLFREFVPQGGGSGSGGGTSRGGGGVIWLDSGVKLFLTAAGADGAALGSGVGDFFLER